MFCAKCGKKVNADWKICPNCGSPLNNMNNNRGRYGEQPEYSYNSQGYQQGYQSRGGGFEQENLNRSHKPSPVAIMWGSIAGVGVLCAVIFGGVMLSSGKENKVETLGDYYVTGCKDVVKVREEPDGESDVLTKLSNGEKISLVNREDDEYWEVYIEAEDIVGYMPNYYLTHDQEAVTDPITEYVNTKEGKVLTIRSLPKEEATAVGILERGQEVTLMADMSGEFDYIYAVDSKTYGYVNSSKLSSKKVKASDTSRQKTANPPSAAPTQASAPDGVLGSGAAPVSHLGQYYVSVQKGYLALRNAKAFDSSNEIGKMYNGEYIWAMDTNGEYWYVYSPSLGMYGYTSSSYLTTSPAAASRSQTPATRSYLGVYYANVTSGYLALRNDTEFNASNEIGKIANGAEVDVIDMSAGQYWYVYVPSLNQEGYVNSQYLR